MRNSGKPNECQYKKQALAKSISPSVVKRVLDDSTSACDPGQTLNGSGECVCATSSPQLVSLTQNGLQVTVQNDGASGSPTDVTNSIHAPINVIQCRKAADSNCSDYYDDQRCKVCLKNQWRSDTWSCMAAPPASGLEKCQAAWPASTTTSSQLWCRQCEPGYGALIGVPLGTSITLEDGKTVITNASNGKCTNSAKPEVLKYYIPDCISYYYQSSTGSFKCYKCRSGYTVDGTFSSCSRVGDQGCDFYY